MKKRWSVTKKAMCILAIGLFALCQNVSTYAEAGNAYQQGRKLSMAARAYISNENLRYDETYVAGGYPEADKGVCTDVVWSAFSKIGISLKDLVDKDIAMHPEAYASVIEVPDPNIDFRRVNVLEIFFERHAESLTTDVDDIFAWQPGDIVIFESSHIAVISDFRNVWGRPYVIQHGKDPAAEEDRLCASDGMEISGHYRWQSYNGYDIM